MAEDDHLVVLKRSQLFKGLSEDDIRLVRDFSMPSLKEYDRNQVIIGQGDPVRKIGILCRGTVLSTKYHYNGETQILRIYKQGEVLALDAVNTTFLTSPVSLISQSECSVLFLSYQKLILSDKLSHSVKETILTNNSEILSNELVRLMYKIDVLSKRTLQERVLTYLSIIREKKGRDTFDISMNQEQFAQYLCVNRSVLSKELNQMRKKGLIDYKKNRYTLYEQTGVAKKTR
ncbi:Crp/Fnr family transcriptional regulator [Anoxybacterium hadale]|uniref:Crp/Fnr family transcriptional regulator n=1 Tax=Anoxybacterium hadale TaxID=3408580 RepID=A0ACD1ADI5_9FIRM|nr:Crp/Fnr family transcriptional regulator [Clostridiales bacterium]